MTFSFGQSAPFSSALFADAFGMMHKEAERDVCRLLDAGAEFFSISDDKEVLTQGIGIPFSVEGRWLLYLYALATVPAARGKGLLRTLLREVAEGAGAAGYSALTLLPATPALAEAYGRMGFTERYPAGGAAVLRTGADLSLTLEQGLSASNAEHDAALYPALGRHLSPELFSFTLSTLGDAVLPFRLDEGYALLARDDRTHALAVSGEIAVREKGAHAFLLFPLRGRAPRRLPEPMPR